MFDNEIYTVINLPVLVGALPTKNGYFLIAFVPKWQKCVSVNG